MVKTTVGEQCKATFHSFRHQFRDALTEAGGAHTRRGKARGMGVDESQFRERLAKLSLWLTCIAAEEPLNFLDHHLREGNALLFVSPDELRRAPVVASSGVEHTFEIGGSLHTALATVISQTMTIEGEASTAMEVVKRKERQWQIARKQLQPFLSLADLWLTAKDGLAVDEINYLLIARWIITPDDLSAQEEREAKRFMQSIIPGLRRSFSMAWTFTAQLVAP